MEIIKCTACGSNDVVIVDGYCICQYCFTKYFIDSKYQAPKSSSKQEPVASLKSKELEFNVNGVPFKMKEVEGGTFWMGENGKTVHQVSLNDFYMGETVVTQALWKAVMRLNPSPRKGDFLPVEQLSWVDCQKFIERLNQITGKFFRLPTEAEWEYAARGGKKNKGNVYAGSQNIDSVAWYDKNSNGMPHEVKSKGPNELGLYDMSGNVWEWCHDWFCNYGNSFQINPMGPMRGTVRVMRGGSWHGGAKNCYVWNRGSGNPTARSVFTGFRLTL